MFSSFFFKNYEPRFYFKLNSLKVASNNSTLQNCRLAIITRAFRQPSSRASILMSVCVCVRSMCANNINFYIWPWYRAAECAQSVRSFGGSEAGAPTFEESVRLRVPDDEEADFILPHFQRVAISGEDTSGVSQF